jgi:hypothetical protein
MRLTGFDFLPDGKRMAVCTWDGDVWLVNGLDCTEAARVRPQDVRPGSGTFL